MVFVSACHSEELGKVFLKHGIPIVVAVSSNLRIADFVASYFSN